jgi:hypothetical protein
LDIGNFLPYLGVPSLIGAFVLIVKIIALARTTKIERILMNDQKNISIFIIQSFFAALITAIMALYFTSLVNGDEEIEFYIALFLVYFILALASVPGAYSVISIFKKKTVHYLLLDEIIDGSKKKLYIHRVTFDDKVIVSDKPTMSDTNGYKKVIEKSFLYDKEIFEENLL